MSVVCYERFNYATNINNLVSGCQAIYQLPSEFNDQTTSLTSANELPSKKNISLTPSLQSTSEATYKEKNSL